MLVFVVAMGVYRVRIAHQHFIQETEAAKEAEMDWDDSALTITVNPMEVGTEGPTTKRHGDPDPGHVLAGWVSEIRLGGSPSDEEALAEGLRE